jgi:TonB family protein
MGVLLALFASAPLHAQGLFAGVLVDPNTMMRLPCVEVALEDSAPHEVAHVLTASDGAFQFDSPANGSYRPRFSIWGYAPAYGAFETLDPTAERERVYQIDFGPRTTRRLKFWPDTVDSPPGKPLNPRKAPLHYPDSLRRHGVEGTVQVQFVVDSAGWVVQPTVRVTKSTHDEFARAVTGFLREVQFEPARRAGRPVCAMVMEPFTFEMVH